MTNAKTELLNRLKDLTNWMNKPVDIKCAEISMDRYYFLDMGDSYDKENSPRKILLKDGHTQEEYEKFLNELDFEYDNGYGLQYLYGTVWLEEPGLWMNREEYDGSEWWGFNKCPEIPDYLLKK